MEKLLNQLLSGEGKLSLLLLQVKQFAEELNDEAFTEYIDKELNAKYKADELPDYRKIQGEIVGTIKDSYGQIINQGITINFSKLSEHVGFDLSIVYVSDGIGFLEDSLEGITSQIIEKAIPSQLVKMLNDTFKYNNPNANLTSASHRFAKTSLQFILTKVRQEVIIGMQKLNKQNQITINTIIPNDGQSKNVFVTYAWEDEKHNDKVISFVDFLIKNGYNASMDRKESQEVSSINFNQMMIEGIQNSDKVLIILSPTYKVKANKFTGGVGTEFSIILEELKSSSNKFIFLSFGDNSIDEICPTGIKGREILNLKTDQDTEFNSLFAKLQNKNIIQFSEVNTVVTEVKLKTIKPFKL
jgi:hypothetical protein